MLSDTSPAAAEVYHRRLAEMTPAERLGIVLALWRAADQLQRSALHRDHPDHGIRVSNMISVREAVVALRSTLQAAGVRFAIGGSWASAAFGEPRFTNDIDILADFTPENLDRFLSLLPPDFVCDKHEARSAVGLLQPFNLIYMPIVFKFDLYAASAFPLGLQELDRAVPLTVAELSEDPLPFVSREDILLAKLHGFAPPGAVSEIQWRDIQGLIRHHALDRQYLTSNAAALGVADLLARALQET
jgi:hypothetical protein